MSWPSGENELKIWKKKLGSALQLRHRNDRRGIGEKGGRFNDLSDCEILNNY